MQSLVFGRGRHEISLAGSQSVQVYEKAAATCTCDDPQAVITVIAIGDAKITLTGVCDKLYILARGFPKVDARGLKAESVHIHEVSVCAYVIVRHQNVTIDRIRGCGHVTVFGHATAASITHDGRLFLEDDSE